MSKSGFNGGTLALFVTAYLRNASSRNAACGADRLRALPVLRFFGRMRTLALVSLLGAATSAMAQIQLAWDDNSTNEAGFRVERADGLSGLFATIATVAPDVSTYTDSTTGSETRYTYRVYAFNDAGNSVAATNLLVINPPSITTIASQEIDEDETTGALAFTIADGETAASSLVVTATSSNTTLIPNANLTLGGSGADRTITAAPAANLSGSATITVAVSDGTLSTTTTFVVTVNAVNDAPTVTGAALVDRAVNEDTSTGALAFTVGDIETAAGALEVSGTSSNTTLVPNANIVFPTFSGGNRTVVVTPAPNQFGTTIITISATDPGGRSGEKSFILTVNNVNDAPTISGISGTVTVAEDTVIGPIAFTIGDSDDDVNGLTVTAGVSGGTGTTLIPLSNIALGGSGANRTVTVTPAANVFGNTNIQINVNDGKVTTTASFAVVVTSANDAPTITPITNRAINEDANTGSIAFTVADVDTTSPGSLTVSGSSSNTTLVPNANIVFPPFSGGNRTVTVTPAANQNGIATISVNVSDGIVTTTTTFQLTVNPVDDPPTLAAIANQSTDEDTAFGPFDLTITEVDGDELTVTATSSNTSLVTNANIQITGTGTARALTITPEANQSGSSTITVTVTDGTTPVVRTFLLTVAPVNDAPTIGSIPNQTTELGTPIGPIAFTIGDEETAATALTVTVDSSNLVAVPLANITLGGSGANRTVSINPAAVGSSSITITVSDGSLSTTSSFTLQVVGTNHAPTITAIGDPAAIDEDTSTPAIGFTIGDVDSGPDTLNLSAASSNLTLVPLANIAFGGTGANRTVTVTPAANQSGAATITISVSDGALTATEDFLVTVDAVNDLPTISEIDDQDTLIDTPITGVEFTVGDIETAAADLTVSGASDNTTLVPDANISFGGAGTDRTISITPAAGQSGTANITVTVNDGSGGTRTATFAVNVAANTPPTISLIADQIVVMNGNTGAIGFTVGDAETAAASLTVSATSSDTDLVPEHPDNLVFGSAGANRTLTVIPATGMTGTSTITVTVTDGNGGTATETFLVTVNANTAPTISSISNRTIETGGSTGAIAFLVGDAESPAIDLTVTAVSSNTALVPNSSVVVSGTGDSRFITVFASSGLTGTTTITVTVSDGSLSTNTTFNVVVIDAPEPEPEPTPVAPVITSQPAGAAVAVGSSFSLSVAGTGTPSPTYQWFRNGTAISGATTSSLSFASFQPANAGVYTVTLTNPAGSVTSEPASVGVLATEKVTGDGEVVGTDIVHPNGNIYDQLLLTGPSATVKADSTKVTRISFVDLNDDIVQVEIFGAGSLSLSLENSSGPALPVKYNQDVTYMKGHATIVVTGVNETTHMSVFSVGRANAVNQALFSDAITYDGVADIALITISSTNGRMGSIRAGNVSFFANGGTTGLIASGITVDGPVFVGDINAFGSARPVLVLGSVADIRITGGNLAQDNGASVEVDGISELHFTAGANSHGVLLPAQANEGVLVDDGVDVTDAIVVNPTP